MLQRPAGRLTDQRQGTRGASHKHGSSRHGQDFRIQCGPDRNRLTVIYAAGASLILVFFAALAELDVERHAVGGHIHNFGDALWWACVTITSVGYGDIAPITLLGRFIAVGVMIAGIALLGTVTATLASFFIDRVADETKEDSDETQAALATLTAEILALRAELRKANPSVGTT